MNLPDIFEASFKDYGVLSFEKHTEIINLYGKTESKIYYLIYASPWDCSHIGRLSYRYMIQNINNGDIILKRNDIIKKEIEVYLL